MSHPPPRALYTVARTKARQRGRLQRHPGVYPPPHQGVLARQRCGVSRVSRMRSCRTCCCSGRLGDQSPSSVASQKPSAARRTTVAHTGSMPSRSIACCQAWKRARSGSRPRGWVVAARRKPAPASRACGRSASPGEGHTGAHCLRTEARVHRPGSASCGGPSGSRAQDGRRRARSAWIRASFVAKWSKTPPLLRWASRATASRVKRRTLSRQTTRAAAARMHSGVDEARCCRRIDGLPVTHTADGRFPGACGAGPRACAHPAMETGDVRRPRTARAVTAAWPSLLVHPKVMHVPCQSGTTAPWACTLWWSKALRAVGDHLQRLRAHVPMPGGGQTAHCWAGRCTPLHAARSPCRQHEAYWFSATCHLDRGGSISCKETWPHTSCSVGGVGLLGESPCADGEESCNAELALKRWTRVVRKMRQSFQGHAPGIP